MIAVGKGNIRPLLVCATDDHRPIWVAKEPTLLITKARLLPLRESFMVSENNC